MQWSDGDITWEPWERVKKLVAVEDYIGEQPALKALKGKEIHLDSFMDLGEVL